jgi:nitroimidazol reductase NimA-like FMN-containing flavoprotein (pyridoxamine 5'-phosphate oxidase superfamily)
MHELDALAIPASRHAPTMTKPASPHPPPSPRATVRRRDRAGYDPAEIEAILDEGLIAHVGLVADGAPIVIPMFYVRQGRALYLHGAGATRLIERGAAGTPLCATVTLLDGLVLGRSAMHHSLNYRSVVVHGVARPIDDPATCRDLSAAMVERLAVGRAAQVRPPSDRELRVTRFLALPLDEASAKRREGGPIDDADDLALPVWAGVVPLALTAAAPRPEPGAGAFPAPRLPTPRGQRGPTDHL